MGTPNPDFRENPKRAVFIVGEINQGMVDRLTPVILQLRGESNEPITVYIDSFGGSTLHARLLIYLLTSTNQDGFRCRMITVVTGAAASAAADILAAGDYAIAYPHTLIHYHGVRTSLGEITHESASSLAEVLKQSNESYALELANRIKRRFFFVYTQLQIDFPKVRNGDQEVSTVECLVHCMTERISGSTKLLRLALEKHKRLNSLLSEYNRLLEQHEGEFVRPADKEAFLIEFLVGWELRENNETTWRFGPKGLDAIREDFVLLADYEDGQHMRNLDNEIREWGVFLLDPEQRTQLSNLSADEGIAFVKEQTERTFRAVWHFLVSVCRALQQGENRLTPFDAFWLGLIDEVPGSSLATLRDVIENFNEVEKASKHSPRQTPDRKKNATKKNATRRRRVAHT